MAETAARPQWGDWNRRVSRLAFPIIISNVSVPLLGAVDTAVVGHLPEAHHLGAVAVGAMVFNFIYWGFGFLRMGTTGFTAQAHGAGDADEVRATVARAMVIGIVGAALLLLIQVPIAALAFSVIEASGNVERLARDYFFIRIWGAPAALTNYVLLGWFLGLQNARAAMWVQIWMNGLNIVLDLLFVLGFGWGVGGVALATVIAEYSAVGFGLVMAARMLRGVGGAFRRDIIADPKPLRRMLSVNADILMRTVLLVFAFAYFTAQGAKMGDVTLAANAVLMNFQLFMAHALDGFAHAVQALAGVAIGARDRGAFRAAVRVSTIWAAWVAVGFTVAYAAAGMWIVAALTGIAEVRAAAAAYLPWAVAMPILSVWAYQLDGIFLGATRGSVLRNAMAVSVLVYIGACLVLVPMLGNHGLWLALSLFMALRGVTLATRYPALERSIGAANEDVAPAVPDH